jgi:hypothetical protein
MSFSRTVTNNINTDTLLDSYAKYDFNTNYSGLLPQTNNLTTSSLVSKSYRKYVYHMINFLIVYENISEKYPDATKYPSYPETQLYKYKNLMRDLVKKFEQINKMEIYNISVVLSVLKTLVKDYDQNNTEPEKMVEYEKNFEQIENLNTEMRRELLYVDDYECMSSNPNLPVLTRSTREGRVYGDLIITYHNKRKQQRFQEYIDNC